ncbi:MAG: DUF3052 domain-containing protein [Acidimicrobiia bacterium]
MAGYSGKPLALKLGITEGKTVGILNMPNYFDIDLGDLPPDVVVHRTELPADIFIVFADRSDEAQRGFERAITYLPPDGAIWVFWPKKSSGVETDLTEQALRDLFLPTGMVDNKVIAVDDTWSGLRFVVREENRGEWRAGG